LRLSSGIPTHLSAGARKSARQRGKSDPIDALNVARAALQQGLESFPAAHLNGCRSMEGGSVDELLDVTVERPVLDQLQVEVGRTPEDRVQPGLTGDDREERHLEAVD
jgi:hypothetical protein